MELIEWLAAQGPWAWIVGGVVLLALELIVPGGVLVWLGAAGIAVGLLSFVVPLSWPMQWLLYGVLSIAAIFIWLKVFKPKGDRVETDRPLLNQRAAQMIGQTAILSEPIVNGVGRMALGDSWWRVKGPDAEAGARMRVIGAEGATLQVERAE